MLLAGRATGSRHGQSSQAARLNDWVARHPPPGPFRHGFWRSPLRGPWLTSVLGVILLAGLPIVAATGLLSYAAYDPWLPGNDPTPHSGWLGFFPFAWPTQPSWLYRLTQGVHVTLGLALLPVVLAKLWSVIPKLFQWPPARSPAQAVERLSLVLVVGGALFELATGIINIQNYYTFPFYFYAGHLYGAWVFIAGLAVHVAIKLPRMVAGLRSRSLRRELRTGRAGTGPESPDTGGSVASEPDAPTISRRGVLGLVGGASVTLAALTVGQTLDGFWRRTALLAPRGRFYGTGPGDFPVNKTASAVGIGRDQVGPSYRLVLVGATRRTLSRDDLLSLPQHIHELPIACVEGWSTTQAWTGVRLSDLARLAGVADPVAAHVESIQRGGPFRAARLAHNQLRDPRSLLALRVNGIDLPLDHGYPARTIIPAAPGVHCTKWVASITFESAT